MATRRPIDDEDDGPRRRDPDDHPRPTRRRKRKRQTDARRSILLAVLLGAGVVAVLATGAVVLLTRNAAQEHGPEGGTGRPGGARGAGPGPDLVTNGGFEDGPDPDPGGPGFTTLEAGSAVVRGWAVTRGSVDYIGPYWQPADGRRSLDLNGNEPGAVTQTLRTRAAQRYRVTFCLSGNCFGGGGPEVKAVVVSAAGMRAEFTFDTAGRTYEDMGWVTKTWEFTAVGAQTVLEFASVTNAPPSCGPALDGVSVVAVGS